MYCSKCGKEIKNDSVFCQYCGNKNSVTDSIMIAEKKLPKSKSKTLTEVRNFMLFLSLLLCLLGFLFGKLSKEYEPIDVAFGYEVDGEMVIFEKQEKVLGGNMEGVRKYKNLSLYCYVAAIGGFAETIILSIGKEKLKKKEN